MIKIEISKQRNPVLQEVSIDKNTTLTSWGTIKINKAHFFPSSFQLKTDDTVIYIDPIEIENASLADYILITHAHPDHLSIKDIQKILKKETIIICSKEGSKKLKHIKNEIHIVKPKEQLHFETLDIETTSAYNTKSVFLWFKAHPKSKENVGYVLTLKNKLRIYHAGDTDYIPEINELNDIHVALIPIGGDNLTMNDDEAAKVINKIRPKITIPMHYEIKHRKILTRFKQLVNKETRVIILD